MLQMIKYYQVIGFLWLTLSVLSVAHSQQDVGLSEVQRSAAQGDWKTAFEVLEKRIAANPDAVEAQFLKGLLLLERGELAAAQTVFLDISRRFPHIPEVYNNLAVVYAAQGEYEQARQALLTAIANDYPQAQANLGDLYAKLAADAYRQALANNPADAASQAKLTLLQGMFAAGE